MAEPCHSACPAGDCAGCAFPPRAQCVPTLPCRQATDCARCRPAMCNPLEHIIDGSTLKHCNGHWCPMFIDARGVMLEAA